jgi:hypothetical protein
MRENQVLFDLQSVDWIDRSKAVNEFTEKQQDKNCCTQ